MTNDASTIHKDLKVKYHCPLHVRVYLNKHAVIKSSIYTLLSLILMILRNV